MLLSCRSLWLRRPNRRSWMSYLSLWDERHVQMNCWKLHGRPTQYAHVVACQERVIQYLTTNLELKSINISDEEYPKFLQYELSHQASSSTINLVQIGRSIAYLSSTSRCRDIDSCASVSWICNVSNSILIGYHKFSSRGYRIACKSAVTVYFGSKEAILCHQKEEEEEEGEGGE